MSYCYNLKFEDFFPTGGKRDDTGDAMNELSKGLSQALIGLQLVSLHGLLSFWIALVI